VFIQLLSLLAVLVLLFVVYVVFLSRHKKSATSTLHIIGAIGKVQTSLHPLGSVLIDGELWQARSRDGTPIEAGQSIRGISFDGPLLIVESLVTEPGAIAM
jgi:membrane-bound ClpP family serine protease